MSNAKWSWHAGKGLWWALPVGVGSLLGIKKPLAYSIAFRDDYSLLLLVLIPAALAFWLGGLRRTSAQVSDQEADLRARVARAGSQDHDHH